MPATRSHRPARPAADPVPVMLVISNLEYGGSQRQVVELANNMSPEEFEVHVCSLSEYLPLAEELRIPADRLHVLRKLWKFDVSVVPRLAMLLRSRRFRIVQSYLFDADIACRLAGRLAGVPAVIGSERNTDYELKRRQLVAYRLTRGLVDLTIANSLVGARFHGRVLGHDMSHYRVVHNGVDTERFAPRDARVTKGRLGLEEDEPVVGMFASFKAQKNHPLFFRTAQRLLARHPRIRFLLVGDMLHRGMHGSAEYMEEMDRLVDELGIRSRCLFLGNRDDVAELYPVCDVTVLPSRFEGTPNVLLESMACGVPVVATRVSDNADIVPDGEAGYVVDLEDEAALHERVSELVASTERRREMGRRARAWVEERFSTAVLARKTAAIYREALEGGIGGEA